MDDDLRRVQKSLLKTCLLIRLVGSKTGKVTSLILPNAAHKNQPGVIASFDKDDAPLEKYDPLVTRETESWEQQKLQALWKTSLDNQDRIRTTKHGCRLFILHAFEEVHYISLLNEDTYYKMASPLEVLAHFSEEIGGLEVADVVTLIGKLTGYWNSDPCVPQFIMTMEEAQKKANRAGLPIANNWLAEFSTSSLLLANLFPTTAWSGTKIRWQTRHRGPGRTRSTPYTRILNARHA